VCSTVMLSPIVDPTRAGAVGSPGSLSHLAL
jgi:hypothetical protein